MAPVASALETPMFIILQHRYYNNKYNYLIKYLNLIIFFLASGPKFIPYTVYAHDLGEEIILNIVCKFYASIVSNNS
jgi:hypothetical protein